MNQEIKQCQSCKQNFTIQPEDFVFYEKMQVPPPTWCPLCRFKRRMIFRNARKDVMRKDDATGELMFSHIPTRYANKVFNIDYWRSDAWDSLEYGRTYDFERPFFEQMKELWRSVPWPGQSVIDMVNSRYCDQAGYCKNAYLCFNGDEMEDSAYTNHSSYLKNCFDLTLCFNDELCYDCILVDRSYRTFFSLDCEDCTDVYMSRDMRGCSNCFGCSNLRNVSYCIFNRQFSKEDYKSELAKVLDGSWLKADNSRTEAENLWLKYPVKFYHGSRSIASTGEGLKDAKDCKDCHTIYDGESLKYCYQNLKTKDSYDYSVWGINASLVYESQTCGDQISNIKFCFDCWPSVRELEYCVYVRSSSNCFGCVGVKKKQYCILNKQYSKNEYEDLVGKIKLQMSELPYVDSRGREYKYGEFFPPEFSPFAYNETQLQDMIPLTKDVALNGGFTWEDIPVKEYETTLDSRSIADSIKEVGDVVLKEKIRCSQCNRAYRIIPQELEFLKSQNLPIPRLCNECRFQRRMRFVNPPIYEDRNCECGGSSSISGIYVNNSTHDHGTTPCGKSLRTSFGSSRKEIIYCEECYQQEMS